MSKNTITWPGVMHVDAKGNVTHEDLTLTFDPQLRAWNCEWPLHLRELRVGNVGSPHELVDHFELACECYQRTVLLSDSAKRLSVRCFAMCDSDGGSESASIVMQVRKASVLSNGKVYLHDGRGSLHPTDEDTEVDHFLVDDTPEVRERLTVLGRSIQLAGEIIAACRDSDDPTAALMAIRLTPDDPAARTTPKLVDPNQPDLFENAGSPVNDEEEL